MYFLLLFLAAFLLISLFTTNWPVKIYHYFLLKQLGKILHSAPQKNGLTLSSVYSQIITAYQGRKLQIRFVEGAVGALHASSGMEIRIQASSPVVLGIYHRKCHQQEWGNFKNFHTGDASLDSQWFILTDNLQAAAEFWRTGAFGALLAGHEGYLQQMQVNHEEIIASLRRFHSPQKVVAFLERLCASIPPDTSAI